MFGKKKSNKRAELIATVLSAASVAMTTWYMLDTHEKVSKILKQMPKEEVKEK